MAARTTILVHFGTNRDQITGGFGTGFRTPTATDKRFYVTGTVEVLQVDDVFTMLPNTIQLDPENDAQVAGTASIAKIAAGTIKADPRFGDFPQRASQAIQSPETSAGLFFIHGFNTSFDDAMAAAARIVVGYGAAKVICFSWPSLGQFGYGPYRADQAAAVKSGPTIALAITSLFTPLHASPNNPSLHLVCHSMGNHALSAALGTLGVASPDLLSKRYFSHAALMAADEDDIGLEEAKVLAPLLTLSDDVNVYTNSSDLALAISQNVNFRPPLGLWGPQDLAKLSTTVLWLNCSPICIKYGQPGYGHGYFDAIPEVMIDVKQVFAGVAPGQIHPRKQDPNPVFAGRRYTIGAIPDDA
jgi:esterase/lipase superfamily enzyme